MGMYTEIVCGFSLKEDTPEVVINALRFMMGDSDKPSVLPEHELFSLDRWDCLFRMSSYYFGFSSNHSVMKRDDLDKCWILSVRADLKNYDSEIETFFDWITPYVDGGSGTKDLIGYSIYEEADEPTLYYKPEVPE